MHAVVFLCNSEIVRACAGNSPCTLSVRSTTERAIRRALPTRRSSHFFFSGNRNLAFRLCSAGKGGVAVDIGFRLSAIAKPFTLCGPVAQKRQGTKLRRRVENSPSVDTFILY